MYINDEAKNLIVTKVTEELLLAGQMQSIPTSSDSLSVRLLIWKIQIGDSHLFNGCCIQKYSNGLVSLNMQIYWDRVSFIKLDANRHKLLEKNANEDEIRHPKRPCGELIWLESAVLSQALVYATLFEQQMQGIKVCDRIHANSLLRHLKNPKAITTYQRPSDIRNITTKTFSDVLFNICKI